MTGMSGWPWNTRGLARIAVYILGHWTNIWERADYHLLIPKQITQKHRKNSHHLKKQDAAFCLLFLFTRVEDISEVYVYRIFFQNMPKRKGDSIPVVYTTWFLCSLGYRSHRTLPDLLQKSIISRIEVLSPWFHLNCASAYELVL